MPIGTLSLLASGLLLIFAGGLVYLGLRQVARANNNVQGRIQIYAAPPKIDALNANNAIRQRIAALRRRIRTLTGSLGSEKLYMDLLRANWHISVAEFFLIRVALTLVMAILGWLLSGSLLPGIGVATITYLIPGSFLRWRINRRKIAFDKQLLDVIMLINGAVRAGFSLLQATEVVVEEMEAPASDEFSRVVQEVKLGLSLPFALENLAERMENDDLSLLVTSVGIHYQVGGNLATMLDAVSETIRERTRLFGEVRVITTQQRYTGYLLSLLPIFLAAMFFIMRPDYMMQLFQPGPMLCIPIGSLIGILAGHFAIQRIAKIKV